ncbi:hypothetical protein FA95DRAFT_1319297 [Auriscalpium vulgare]|uniref:Uncharacterized protein n=1 Tax=Auriscalpium vulgare TaxID=40419 RepID=A0ACB8S8B0_9AGAM|nr:hypothetical protein FA95DRAFT_1319297 [Auriscalpium vulgare]
MGLLGRVGVEGEGEHGRRGCNAGRQATRFIKAESVGCDRSGPASARRTATSHSVPASPSTAARLLPAACPSRHPPLTLPAARPRQHRRLAHRTSDSACAHTGPVAVAVALAFARPTGSRPWHARAAWRTPSRLSRQRGRGKAEARPYPPRRPLSSTLLSSLWLYYVWLRAHNTCTAHNPIYIHHIVPFIARDGPRPSACPRLLFLAFMHPAEQGKPR